MYRSLAGAAFGITRRSAFRAVWHLALFGISRRLALGAVQLVRRFKRPWASGLFTMPRNDRLNLTRQSQ